MTAPAPAPLPGAGGPSTGRLLVAFLAVVAVAGLVLTLSIDHLGLTDDPSPGLVFADQPWFSGWVRWDAGWYHRIAVDGYSYVSGEQSTVAFFPAYPLLIRLLAAGPFSAFGAGIAITVVAGAASVVLFARWCRRWLDGTGTWVAVACLMAWPFAFFLYGAMYSDALFLALAVGAFLLLERDRPLAAGLVGALATATRVVGPALVVGLLLRGWERSRVPGNRLPRWWAPALVLSAAGVAAYCAYLGSRFGSPLAFVEQTGVPGWDQAAGPRTWFKIRFMEEMLDTTGAIRLRNLAHLAAFATALAFTPRVVRRFGWAYGAYVALVLVVPGLSSKNFLGLGRYALAAFPAFAAAGDLLAGRPRLRVVALTGSAACLVVTTSLFARGFYLS
ncbi:MAG: mannosyltransferase family protein [Acidimicrobiia bacterium]